MGCSGWVGWWCKVKFVSNPTALEVMSGFYEIPDHVASHEDTAAKAKEEEWHQALLVSQEGHIQVMQLIIQLKWELE